MADAPQITHNIAADCHVPRHIVEITYCVMHGSLYARVILHRDQYSNLKGKLHWNGLKGILEWTTAVFLLGRTRHSLLVGLMFGSEDERPNKHFIIIIFFSTFTMYFTSFHLLSVDFGGEVSPESVTTFIFSSTAS